MRFPMLVCRAENGDYGGLLPDFPGCTTCAATLEELAGNAQDAVETWMDGEDPSIFPAPSRLEKVLADHPEADAVLLAEVSTAFLEGRTRRINITVPEFALAAMDRAARAEGLSRSAWIVRAALAHAS